VKAKGLLLAALATIIALSIPIVALAGSSATITITMSGPSVAIDIEVTPTDWQISPVALNSSYLKDFTLVNRGSVKVDTTIMGTNAEGSGYEWWLSLFPGYNQYEIEYDIEGDGGTGNVTTIPTNFVQDLTKNHSRRFSLTVKTPTDGDAPGMGQSIQATVTIHAVQG